MVTRLKLENGLINGGYGLIVRNEFWLNGTLGCHDITLRFTAEKFAEWRNSEDSASQKSQKRQMTTTEGLTILRSCAFTQPAAETRVK